MYFRLAFSKLSVIRNCIHTSRGIRFPVQLKMPSLSPTMNEGSIVNWLKKEGDEVLAGDALCEVQTDKAVMTFESDEDGILAKILVSAGSPNVTVGSTIAILASADENWQEIAANASASAAATTPKAALPQQTQSSSSPVQASEIPTTQSPRSTSMGPAVRLLLQSHSLDGSQIPSTGPHGRLLKGDVLSYVANNKMKPAEPIQGKLSQQTSVGGIGVAVGAVQSASFTDIPLTNMRKVIAQRLTESKSSIPHEYIRTIACLDNLNELRRKIKTDFGIKLSINDFIIKACALGLRLVPDLNAIYDPQTESPIYLRSVDISMAVATNTGLITPILHSTDTLTISDISKLSKQLAKKARDGRLQPSEFQGGSFTISNLGMYGIREFTAIVNLPQVAILAVGTGLPEASTPIPTPPIDSMKGINFSTNITLTLSVDSRCVGVNTATETCAGRFLRYVSHLLTEHPQLLIHDDPICGLLEKNKTDIQSSELDEFDTMMLSREGVTEDLISVKTV
ncbi:unnamed protein product [Trichobilharzia szidati]|nr:unnamed protein product [Trichobilharzia szidati]